MPLVDERVISTFADNSYLSYAQGSKDRWCVYYTAPPNPPIPLLDRQYFQILLELAEEYGAEPVYADFVSIYDRTTDEVDELVLADIQGTVAAHYPNDLLRAAKVFTTLYMAMVSEFYYITPSGRPSRLQKRVKRLGVYQILFTDMTVEQAANYSKGQNYNTLNTLCLQYGF